jgi:hypothetical protein
MRSDPRSSSWRVGGYLFLAATLSGCGASDEPLSRKRDALDSFIFKRQQEPLVPVDVQPYDEFGTAVGISSRWAAVGSPGRDFDPSDPLDNSGRATVFERKQGNSWEETARLELPESWPGARLGSTVAATDSVIAVGAPEADPSNTGMLPFAGVVASFTYRDGVWTPEPLLHDPSEAPERVFGSALAMDERTLLVSAYGGNQVFAFPRTANGWGAPFVIDSPVEPDGYFGFALALDDPYAFIGAPYADGQGQQGAPDQGAVFIFKREASGEWISQGEIQRNFINANDLFGAAIASRNGLTIATAYGDGSAVLVERDQAGAWGNPIAISSGPAASDSGFGWSAAIGARSSVWVGAYLDDDFNGTVYPFVRVDDNSWQLLSGVSFEDGGWFGYSVASASGALMVGAPTAGTDVQGAVYVIETSDGSGCIEDADCFSAHCVGGICCNSRCEDACYSCLSSEKASESADGTCEPKRSGSRDPACADEGPQSCETDGLCDGRGNCERYPLGTQCGDPFCSANDLVGAALCDGKGACEPPAAEPCKSYACNDGACQDLCAGDVDCAEGNYCDDGHCLPMGGLGVTCVSAKACISGVCADGKCCDRSCDGKCEACAEIGSVGRCLPLNAGSPPRTELTPSEGRGEICARLFCDGVERGTATMPADSSTVCAPAGCAEGVEVAEGRCNGEGQCDAPVVKSCGAYACSAATSETGRPAQCLTSCDSVSDCALDFYCTTEHECRPIEPAQSRSSACSVSAPKVGQDWSCLGLVTSAITFLGLRRRRPQQGTPTSNEHHSLR